MIVAVGMQHRFVVSESVKLRLNVGDLGFNECVHLKWNLNRDNQK